MKYCIQFVNFDPETQRVIKVWHDNHIFLSQPAAFEAAQTTVRASQSLIKHGILFYRIIKVQEEVE